MPPNPPMSYNESTGLWTKIKSSTKGIHSSFSNLSLIGEQDGSSEDSTLVSKALLRYYQEKNQPVPDWLGVRSEPQQHKSHTGLSSQPAPQPQIDRRPSHSLQDIYNKSSQARQTQPYQPRVNRTPSSRFQQPARAEPAPGLYDQSGPQNAQQSLGGAQNVSNGAQNTYSQSPVSQPRPPSSHSQPNLPTQSAYSRSNAPAPYSQPVPTNSYSSRVNNLSQVGSPQASLAPQSQPGQPPRARANWARRN
ncbi:hypothetical protein BABINDRAFT_12119 [Babjeviella inositovora NRRL Y-12698]|uniref:Mso1 N-terminal domain-containing protein n=1 Tax=Babjeviella inositovora NRRL Y-12698 TaxID=984486 RepID=A0A1E3QWP7_9ASCO|nr:uncharacterized protein BABINDRAFT_12119 [Babjeviella inositovora NRRL Y-12698]ODQ82070.1 hypothetical protein BABINDRAFT_12119 [Babjeviella inositovora NRRL Y-12698]